MIEVKNLVKKYEDGTRALDIKSLKLDKRITCILGRNGAGKTTLLRILSTQLMPSSGTALIDGADIMKDTYLVREKISSIPQELRAWGVASAHEHILMYLSARGIPKDEYEVLAEDALKELGMWHVRDKAMGQLSGGMKRKVFVAMALASKADVIFLDEPTTGLDPISRLEVWSALRKIKGTIVITTHYMEEARELADEVVLFDRGKVVARGSVQDLLKVFGKKVRVEGLKGKYKIAGSHISYMEPSAARRMIGKGYTIKQVSLEDLFIIRGGEAIES